MIPRSPADGSIPSLISGVRGTRFSGLALALALIVSLAWPPLTPQAAGSNYYVDSANGSDSNPGTSPDAPWKTLGPVNGRAFEAGDVVNFARGSTFSGGLVIGSSGVEGNPITFQAYGDGARPVFVNSGQYSRSISIDGSWTVVQGLAVRDADEFGVRIGEGATHNVVRDCEAVGVGIGVAIYGQNNLIANNHIHDLKMITNTQGGDDDYGAYAIGLYGSYNEIAYNRIEHCKAPSYDYGQDGGAIEFYNNVTGSYIHHNWAEDNRGFVEVGGGSAIDTRVAYNVAINNGTFAWLHLSGNFAADVSNFRVENNTVVETVVDQNSYEVFGFSAMPSESTFILRNNIFYVNQYQYLSSKSGYAHDHNIYHFLQGSTQLGSSLGEGEKLADPLFVNIGGGDYHLQPGSPAIDAGADLGYGQDYAGEAVPGGAAPDAGAYEFGAAVGAAPAQAPAATSQPATPAPAEPTPAPVEPTPTDALPTATPVLPTLAPIVPTATLVVPAPTPILPTATLVASAPDPFGSMAMLSPNPAPPPAAMPAPLPPQTTQVSFFDRLVRGLRRLLSL